LGLFADGKVEHHRRHGSVGRFPPNEPVEGVNAPVVAMLASQRLADAADLDALSVPRQNVLAKGLHRRHMARILDRTFACPFASAPVMQGNGCIVRHRARRIQPVLAGCELS